MTEAKIYDLIIIGGGPAGYTAAIYGKRAALETILIEKGVPGGQLNNTDEVENWPGTINISGADLAINISKHAASYELEVLSREVVTVEPDEKYHSVKLDNGETLLGHAVILSTGGSPRKLDIPGENELYGKGVSYCAVCDGFFFRGQVVIVVGGGDTALEEALYLAKLAKKVYIAHRRDAFRGSMILQKRVAATENIEVLWDTVLSEIKADDQGVCAVTCENTQTKAQSELGVDGVFIFIGFVPNNQLVPVGTQLNANGYVLTDDKCETINPGIFAVGDLKEKFAKQIVTAAADGCTAALAAAHYVENKKAGL